MQACISSTGFSEAWRAPRVRLTANLLPRRCDLSRNDGTNKDSLGIILVGESFSSTRFRHSSADSPRDVVGPASRIPDLNPKFYRINREAI